MLYEVITRCKPCEGGVPALSAEQALELKKALHADWSLSKARKLSELTAINVTDNQGANMRLSSLALAAMLVREGLEPVLQLTCRDRNRMALQSDLLVV